MVFTKWVPLMIFCKQKIASFKRSRKSPERPKFKTFIIKKMKGDRSGVHKVGTIDDISQEKSRFGSI